jgi:predicted NBD/HSP70 family sugar kinase
LSGKVRGSDRSQRSCVIGVDLGGTKVTVALSDLEGKILAEVTAPTDPAGGMRLVEQIAELAEELRGIAAVSSKSVVATAVGGAGAPVDGVGALAQAPNLVDADGLDE